MLQRGVGCSSSVQGRTVHSLAPQRPLSLPRRAKCVGTPAPFSRLRAGVACRAEHRLGAQLPSGPSSSADGTPGKGPTFFTYTRMIFLTGVMAATVFLDKRSAHAATPVTPPVHTEVSRVQQPERGLWGAVKSASTAPLHALDHLLFPDADEPISLIRTSRDFTSEHQASTAARSDSSQTSATPAATPAAPAAGVFSISEPPAPTMTSSKAPASTSTAKEDTAAFDPHAQFGAAAVAQLVSSAAVSSYHKVSSTLSSAASHLTPSWPAESCALSGLSQLPAGLTARLSDKDSAVLARQLVRGSYALAGLVVAVMAWQLAAAVGDADNAAKKAKGKTLPERDTGVTAGQNQAVLLTNSGVSTAVLQPEDARPRELEGKQIMGPYCVRLATPASTEEGVVAGDLPAALQGKHVVGPFCVRPVASAPPTAVTQAAADEDGDLPEALQGKTVVGPFCMVPNPAAAAAAEAVHEALLAEAAAMKAAAQETAVDAELSSVLTAEAASAKAGVVVEAAAAAATAAEQGSHESNGTVDRADASEDSNDNQPLFRVDGSNSCDSVYAVSSLESALAAEAVKEALIAESAAATAAIAAERANAAAHKIEEAIMEEAAHMTAVAAAAHEATEAEKEQQAAESDAAAAVTPGAAVSEDAVWLLAAEAKQAEAAAAMAKIRRALGVRTSKTSPDSAANVQQAATAQRNDLHALVAEAIAAEAAAAAAAGVAANIDQAELVAEAVAAEAAAAAALAAADAAGSASAADISAGQAAELTKCHRCGPLQGGSAEAAASNSKVQLSSSVSVSWVLPASDGAALQQLTSLAAVSGNPAVITSTTTATSTVEPTKAAVLASSDVDAFKDEFPMGPELDVSGGAAAVDSDTAAADSGDSSKSCSLADALNVASQAQMQAASATAVQQAHARLVRVYKARRSAVTPAGNSNDSCSTTAKPGSASAVPRSSSAAGRAAGKAAAAAASAAASHLGVSDLALALALAQLDARNSRASSPVPAEATQVAGNAVNSKPQVTGADTAAAAAADAAVMVEEPTPAATLPAAVNAASTATEEAAGAAAHRVVSASSSGPQTAPVRPDESKTAQNLSNSATSGSFEVPVIREGGNPYSAVADALISSVSSSKASESTAKETTVKKADEPADDTANSNSPNTFEVPVVVDDGSSVPVPRASFRPGSGSSGRAFKGFDRGFGRGARVRYYVPLDGGSAQVAGAAAAAAEIDVRVTQLSEQQPTNIDISVESGTVGEAAAEKTGSDGSSSGSSVPVEWISTPNSSRRAKLRQRAAAILAADEAAAVAEMATAQTADVGNGAEPGESEKRFEINFDEVGRYMAKAASLVADAPGGKDLLESLAEDMSTAYGMPDLAFDNRSSGAGASKAAGALPTGWRSKGAAASSKNSSSSSWSDVTAQLAADLEDELAGLLTSAAARLDQDSSMINAYTMPQVPVPGTEGIRAAEQPAADDSVDSTEPFGRYVPGSKAVGNQTGRHADAGAAQE